MLFLIAILVGCGFGTQDGAISAEALTDGGSGGSVPVTVQVTGSDGTGVSGVTIRYGSGGSYGTWFFPGGPTGGDGKTTANLNPGTYSFQALHNNGHAEQLNVPVSGSGPVTVNFNTYKLTLRLEECDTGNGIDGGQARFGAGSSYGTSYFPGGLTGSSGTTGETEAEFFPGAYTFQMLYKLTAEIKPVNMPASNHKETWQASKVTLSYSGSISYGGGLGDSTFFSKPTMYLLPGTYKFHFRGCGRMDLTIDPCSTEKTVACLKLTDHTGAPMNGGTARGGLGGSYWTWHVPGQTGDDGNGVLIDIRDGLHTNMSYEMRYNGTTQVKTQDVSVNSVFEFQTILLTLRLETCGGTPLDGGDPRFGPGSTYTTSWFPGGVTGSSAPGEIAAEFFPGTYSFQMLYKATAEAKVSVVIPNANTMLTWQTTKVTLQYSGAISYGGGGDSTWFNKPSMELLPGTYKFHFRGAGRMDLTFSGCEFTSSAFALKLIDSGGSGIAGGTGEYYDGGWQSIPGSTGADGILLHAIPGLKSTLSFRMTHAGASQQKSQNIATNSIVVFQTELVTMKLFESDGTTVLNGGAEYYAGGWNMFGGGTTTTTMELLPLSYSFRVSYGGASQQKSQNVGADPNVVFQTELVTMKLFESDGTTVLNGGAEYYAGGWNTFGTSPTTTTMELLPVSYSFRVSYAGASQQKSQNVGADPNVVFQTGQVHSDSGTCTDYYASGWKAFTQDMELLPVNYAFRFSDGFPQTSYTIAAGTTTNIH